MIVASLATVPSREAALKAAVESLLPQVDRVRVYLNVKPEGFGMPPEWIYRLRDPSRITWVNAMFGDLGDAGKFAIPPEGDFVLTCDDDLIYQPGYVSTMVQAVLRHDRRAVVTLQGRALSRPLQSFYRDRAGQTKYRLQDPLEVDVPVDVAGTGCAAWHTDTIRFQMEDFPPAHRNMADVHASLVCARRGVPIVCAAHTGAEVKLSPHVDHLRDSIWARARRDDRQQTNLANVIYALRRAERKTEEVPV
jgi:hypothetical protein